MSERFSRRQVVVGGLGAALTGLGGCAVPGILKGIGTGIKTSKPGLGLDGATLIATVTQGELQGARDGSVLSFKRVPYAANPFIAANRFKAPQPMAPWSGVRDASKFGPMPPQPSRAPGGGMAGAADDLTLNIWAPANARNAPVLVWLPGGDYYRVDASEGWYDGSSFARQGIVVVTVNYRVGIDGFMVVDGMPANRGLLDSVAALEWIKANIAIFGGDAGNVTLAGQSAGAQSVMLLMGMTMAQGLFHKAIAQSPPQNHLTLAQAQSIASATTDLLKVAPTSQALVAVPLPVLIDGVEAMVTDLRNRARWGTVGGQPPYLPVIDGTVLTAPPLAALQRNAKPGMPLLIGCTDEEARLYLVPGGAIDRVSVQAVADALTGAKLPRIAASLYADERPNSSLGDLMAFFESDHTFRMPTLRYAEQRVAAGAPVWLYNFSWSSPAFGGRLGAAHVVDVPYAFNTLGSRQAAPFLGGPGHQPLADEMHGRWARFVKTGDAGWPRYEIASRPTMRFDTTSGVVADPLAERRELWAGIGFE